METGNTQTAVRRTHTALASFERDGELTQKRLDALLAANAAVALEKSLFASEREKLARALMVNPWSVEKTFAYFGLLLGAFPPLAIFVKFFTEKGVFRTEDFWIIGVVAIVNLISATVGYFSGRVVGRVVGELEKSSWTRMLLALPFIGIFWGILAGGAGGIIIFGVGAFFGAALGALVGAAALPIFTIFHRALKNGDQIERDHFLPVAFGTALTISAFILSM